MSEISLYGKAEKAIKPDQINIRIRINAESLKYLDVYNKLLEDNKNMVKEIKEINKKIEIFTEENNIYPNYTYEGNKSIFNGYKGSTQIIIKIKNQDFTSDIFNFIDSLSSKKETSINYVVSDIDNLETELLQDAIKDLTKKAEAVARSLNKKEAVLIKLEEGALQNEQVRPRVLRAAANVDIEGSEITYKKRVTGVFDIR